MVEAGGTQAGTVPRPYEFPHAGGHGDPPLRFYPTRAGAVTRPYEISPTTGRGGPLYRPMLVIGRISAFASKGRYASGSPPLLPVIPSSFPLRPLRLCGGTGFRVAN
jgi:hypothetical protein